ncbi:thiamine-phosphate kinase [Azoarcus sp. L1K30]|uniref:thiamine-phosphate kinase n=1 Tax=Azoarcus sp. L1K30 TaxID=2820277 RepID=UPI001B82E052|nr:thiamine-phosphate kinase [Azoarcus sp. L1K30]MBR0566442.1 thiamine-phosphate kinase [Azoarcus sp. L1K30]
MPSEFELIRRYFSRATSHTDLAGGDDAALMHTRPGMQLAVSTDLLVAGTHFFGDTDPHGLGWKTLAVNLSDLAAMGAEPRWAFLGLTLPTVDEGWLSSFADGLFACASRYGVDIAGGDTTRGPLALSITILGEVPTGLAITRCGGRAGDDIWISGQPGRAALGLASLQGKVSLSTTAQAECVGALQRPVPRIELGLELRTLASAMLDVSDGLLGDLGHIVECSGCGAIVDVSHLPLQPLLDLGVSEASARRSVLAGGDDYELLFCAPPRHRAALRQLAQDSGVALTRIGELHERDADLMLREADGRLLAPLFSGYDHFA